MLSTQRGFFSDLTIFGWICIVSITVFIIVSSLELWYSSEASVKDLKEINHLIYSSLNTPYEAKFKTSIEPFLKDGMISREEATQIKKIHENILIGEKFKDLKK